MTTSARLAAAIASGLMPAIVAFVVMMVVDGDVDASLITAVIIWIGMTAVMWVRFGKRGTPGRR